MPQGTTRPNTAGSKMLRLGLLAALAVLAALPATPASGAGAPLDCTGSTIYAANRPTTQGAGTHGTIFALSAGTVSESTATMTEVTTMPGNSYPNALGVTSTGLFAVDQSGSTGSANVWSYNSSTEAWTSHAGSGGTPSGFVAGAVDPVNDIYYYADYTAGTSSTPGKATVYGYNTTTNTAISGVMATFNLPDGNSSAAQNGDFTFDADGNLYVLASDAKTRAVGVIKASGIPSTGAGAEPTISTLSSVADTSAYNGIAFDNLGHLYLEGSASGVFVVTRIDPNNGETLAGPTPYSSNAQTNSDVDLASCAPIPTLTAQVDIPSRAEAGDQFHLEITGGSITGGNTATTTGSSTGVQSQAAGPVIASSETEYTFTATASKGSLSNYDVAYTCLDAANGNETVASGSGSTFKLKFPTVTLGQAKAAPAVVCTFTTTPKQIDLAVTDSVTPESTIPGKQVTYKLNVTNNGPDTATGTKLTDTLPAGVKIISAETSQGSCTTSGKLKCSLGTLANGASATVTVIAEVIEGTAPGTLEDAASTEAEETDTVSSNNTAHATLKVTAPQVDLAVKDSVTPGATKSGKQVTYTLTVTNNGPDTATGTKLTDTLPAGISIVSAETSQGSCTTSPKLKCSLGSLANGASATVTVIAEVAEGTAPGSLQDAAATEGEQADPVLANNSAHATVKVTTKETDLAVTDSVAPEATAAGKQVIYTLTVTNNGPDTATGTKLTDTLPAGIKIISTESSQGSCTTTSGLTCSLGTLANGASATVTVVAEVIEGATGTLEDAASVASNQADPVLANNSAHATVTVTPPPPPAEETKPPAEEAAPPTAQPPATPKSTDDVDVQVTTKVDHPTASPGEEVTYTITVTNAGTEVAPGVILINTPNGPLRVLSATSSQGTCTVEATVSCQLSSIEPGQTITITVRGVITGPGNIDLLAQANVGCSSSNVCPTDINISNNSAPAAVIARKHMHLRLAERVGRKTLKAGHAVWITLKVTNPNSSALAHARLCTQLPAGLVYVSSPHKPTLSNGSLCWKLGTLARRGVTKIHLLARALGGAAGLVTNMAVASAAGVSHVHAHGHLTILANAMPGPALVTG